MGAITAVPELRAAQSVASLARPKPDPASQAGTLALLPSNPLCYACIRLPANHGLHAQAAWVALCFFAPCHGAFRGGLLWVTSPLDNFTCRMHSVYVCVYVCALWVCMCVYTVGVRMCKCVHCVCMRVCVYTHIYILSAWTQASMFTKVFSVLWYSKQF